MRFKTLIALTYRILHYMYQARVSSSLTRQGKTLHEMKGLALS